jgi:hypothetical protein
MTPTALGRSSIEYEGKSRVEKIPEAPGSQKTARLSRRSTKRGISCSRCPQRHQHRPHVQSAIEILGAAVDCGDRGSIDDAGAQPPPALPAEGAALMARRLLLDIASAKNKPSVDFCGYC